MSVTTWKVGISKIVSINAPNFLRHLTHGRNETDMLHNRWVTVHREEIDKHDPEALGGLEQYRVLAGEVWSRTGRQGIAVYYQSDLGSGFRNLKLFGVRSI